MRKKMDSLPEVFTSSSGTTRLISRMIKDGKAAKIGPALYTTNIQDAPDVLIKRNAWRILGLLAPGAVVSFRTAFENRPALDGSMFVTGAYRRQIILSGIAIRQTKGPGPVAGDMPYMDSLYLASRPRSFLENLMPSRKGEKAPKTVSREEVEKRLTEVLRISGEDGLNKLRDDARGIAPLLQMEDQFRILDGLIAGLLRSRPTRLASPAARAYASGEPYDPQRIPAFDVLFAQLRSHPSPSRPDKSSEPPAFHNVAFFDAYFSNYIEGTEFPVDQAIRIVFEGERPVNRPADAHDVLGTYRLSADRMEMQSTPKNFDDFIKLLKRRHAIILEARGDELPGQFKSQSNQAGATLFVAPELVVGTLRQGYKMYEALDTAFSRALFMMFLIAEVHPFVDGNGRIARIMMNAELLSHAETRIFIPSVFRNEYVNSLKRLTNRQQADAFMRIMDYVQLFVSSVDFDDLEEARQFLAAHKAFHDPADDVKLKMPV